MLKKIQEFAVPYIISNKPPCSLKKNKELSTVSQVGMIMMSLSILIYLHRLWFTSYYSKSLSESDEQVELPISVKLLLSSFVLIFFLFVIIILRNLSFYDCSYSYSIAFLLVSIVFLQTFLSEINKVILKYLIPKV